MVWANEYCYLNEIGWLSVFLSFGRPKVNGLGQ